MTRAILIIVVGVFAGMSSAMMPASGDESCPGTLCSDCSASGDCPNLACASDESLFCVAFPFGSTDSGQRCTFCEDPSFELP